VKTVKLSGKKGGISERKKLMILKQTEQKYQRLI